VDYVRAYFGMRKISLGRIGGEKNLRPLLNDKFVFHMGMLDQVRLFTTKFLTLALHHRLKTLMLIAPFGPIPKCCSNWPKPLNVAPIGSKLDMAPMSISGPHNEGHAKAFMQRHCAYNNHDGAFFQHYILQASW